MKRIIYTIFSYISAFTYGAYAYGYFHGHKPEPHQWILTGLFGILFYYMSQEEKNKTNS